MPSLRYSVLLLLCALLLLAAGFTATLYAQPHTFREEQFTTEHGLPAKESLEILQDRLGFLWIGAQNGLVRYDGYQFTTYLHDPQDSTSIGGRPIWALFEDAAGTIWVGGANWGVGTGWGLSRFDRTTARFTTYRHDLNDSQSLSSDEVRAIYESPSEPGVLWVGTAGGLNRLDVATGAFTHFRHDSLNASSLSSDFVGSLFEDSDGTFWVGSWGLNRFDRETGTFTRFLPNPRYPVYDPTGDSEMQVNRINAIDEEASGIFWMATSGGLVRFDPQTGGFKRFLSNPGERDPLIQAVQVDQAGDIWVGTHWGGLFAFDPEHERFSRYGKDALYTSTRSIYEDRSGVLWVGATEGLTKLTRLQPFTRFTYAPDRPVGLSDKFPRGILEDRSGSVWIGHEKGLERIDRQTGQITRYLHDSNDPDRTSRPGITNVYEDRAGMIWTASCHAPWGLSRFDPVTEAFTHYRPDLSDPGSLSGGCINGMLEDHKGNFWVAVFNRGLNRLDRATGGFTRFLHDEDDPHSIASNNLIRVYEDRGGVLWIGTSEGVSKFDAEDSSFTNIETPSGVMDLHEDRAGRVWVGTSGAGLANLDRQTGTLIFFTTDDGLAHNTVLAILEDDEGFLWISTANGLSRFDPPAKTFTNYTTRDGLVSNVFSGPGAFKSPSGELFFTSQGGAIAFYPDQMRRDAIPPEVVLTSLRAGSEVLTPRPEGPLRASITVAESVELPYRQRDLTFEYAGLHYRTPEGNRYRYRMEGYDDAWHEAGLQRRATYTNLDPGGYVFRVTASNPDGVWNEEGVSLRVTILPPWWRTWWAYTLYGLLLLTAFAAAYRWQHDRIVRREQEKAHHQLEDAYTRLDASHHQLEEAHQHLKATQKQLIQSEKMASLGQLTAGIAHEIKNPLNFVNNFAEVNEELADELREALAKGESVNDLLDDLEQNASVIAQHGKRADGIVSAMMQHASGGSGQREATDLNALVEEYVGLAYHGKRAQTPGFTVEIERDLDGQAGMVEVVPQEIGRVLLNLLSNAFDAVHGYAAKAGGDYAPIVAVSTRQVDGQVEIQVSDNGPGIPEDVREKIFEPFFTTKPTGSGTGLGLSLAYDIVTQGHRGTLGVESTEGGGATFVVTLPG